MASPDTLRYTRIPLAHGSGAIPAVGFGTLIPDLLATKQATKQIAKQTAAAQQGARRTRQTRAHRATTQRQHHRA